MRTSIDIPDGYVHRLDQLKQQRGVSRSELVREAVQRYLESAAGSTEDTAFGIWAEEADTREDGVAYQSHLRSEWDS